MGGGQLHNNLIFLYVNFKEMLSLVYILYLPTIISCDFTFGCIKHYHVEGWNIFVIDQKMNVEYVKSDQFQQDEVNFFLN